MMRSIIMAITLMVAILSMTATLTPMTVARPDDCGSCLENCNIQAWNVELMCLMSGVPSSTCHDYRCEYLRRCVTLCGAGPCAGEQIEIICE